MMGSQSPIQISDDDDDAYDDAVNEDKVVDDVDTVDDVNTIGDVDTVNNGDIVDNGVTCTNNDEDFTDKCNETTNEQVDFAVEGRQSDEEKNTKRKHDDDGDDDDELLTAHTNKKRQKIDPTEPKKYDCSTIQAILSAGLDKNKLYTNRRKIAKKDEIFDKNDGKDEIFDKSEASASVVTQPASENANIISKDPELHSPIENADLYQDQVYDIGSKFNTNTDTNNKKLQATTTRKSTVKTFPLSSRRESLEKDLATLPSVAKPPKKSTTTAKPASKVYTLPVISPRKTYTIELFQDSILACDPKFLQDGKDLEVKSQLNSVSSSFDSYDQYVKTFWPLMLLEIWEQLRRDWEVSLHVQKPYIIESYDETKNVRTRFLRCHHIEMIGRSGKVPSYDKHSIQNDLVLLTYSKEQKCFGIVQSMEWTDQKDNTNQHCRKFTLGVLVKNNCTVESIKHVNIMKLTSLTTVLRQWKAIIGFQSSLLAKDILKPFRQQTYTMRTKLIPRSEELKKLNPDQFQALSSVVSAVEQPYTIPKICLIQGPPGTGKSYTVKKIIAHLLQVEKNFTKRNLLIGKHLWNNVECPPRRDFLLGFYSFSRKVSALRRISSVMKFCCIHL